MKKQSVDVLNDAYEFELKLNWQLFKAEQERVLYGPSNVGWKPGIPIWTRPRGEGFGEQHTRRMFDLIPINRFHSTPFQIYMIDERCVDCEVSWMGPDPCWICGKEAYSLLDHVLPPALDFEGNTDLILGSQLVTPNAVRAILGLSPIDEPLVGQSLPDRIMDECVVEAREISVGFREISRSNDMITYAIQDVVMVGLDFNGSQFSARLEEMEQVILNTMRRSIEDSVDHLRGMSAQLVTYDEAQEWCSAHPEIGVPVTWTAHPIRTEAEIQLPEGGIPPEMLDPNYITPPNLRIRTSDHEPVIARLQMNRYYGTRVATEERRPRGEV